MSATKPTKQLCVEGFDDTRLTALAKQIEDLVRSVGTADRFLRQREVLPLSGFGSQSTLKIKIKNGEFPAPIKISEGRLAFSEREVVEWQRTKIAERNAILAREPNRKRE
jgi:predicted DNA-binding transcriptional regulator AlpA